MSNSLLKGGIQTAWQTIIPAVNAAYKNAGMSQYIMWAATFYDGGDQPDQATDDGEIDAMNFPMPPNTKALGAGDDSINVVLWCSKTDANGQSIGDAYVNARGAWDIFTAASSIGPITSIAAFQQFVNETVQKSRPVINGSGIVETTATGDVQLDVTGAPKS